MRPLYPLLTLILLFPAFCFAQRYSPGYVITLQGDTIKGFINQREWDSNPRSVSFKEDSQGIPRNYSVADIKQFTVDSLVTYTRYICKISLAPVEENHLQAQDTSSRTDTVFMQVLQTGKNIALLSYSDDIKTRYYVLENNSNQPNELIYRVYVRNAIAVTAASPAQTHTENIYIQQLNDLALKYGALTTKLIKDLSGLEYHERDIVKITALINGMQKPQHIKKRTTFYKFAFATAMFGVIAYLVLSKVHF